MFAYVRSCGGHFGTRWANQIPLITELLDVMPYSKEKAWKRVAEWKTSLILP
jgi:hypothetical protein